jgi:hypothetical protein
MVVIVSMEALVDLLVGVLRVIPNRELRVIPNRELRVLLPLAIPMDTLLVLLREDSVQCYLYYVGNSK